MFNNCVSVSVGAENHSFSTLDIRRKMYAIQTVAQIISRHPLAGVLSALCGTGSDGLGLSEPYLNPLVFVVMSSRPGTDSPSAAFGV